MKKFVFTLLVAVLLPVLAMAQAKTVPYFSNLGIISSKTFDTGWTTVDLNGAESASKGLWYVNSSVPSQFSSLGVDGAVTYGYASNLPGDDWLISPAIHLETGKEYKVGLVVATSSANTAENYEVRMATSADASALAEGTFMFGDEGFKINAATRKAQVFTVDAEGDYYFGIHCYSPKDKYSLYATQFKVVINELVPAAVSNLTATPDADGALKVQLSWTLPTKDADDVPLTDDQKVTSVEVWRDGALLTTLEGEATGYLDETVTSGYHTYEVFALIGEAKSAGVSVKTKYVGPIEPFTLPYTADLTTNAEVNDAWTIINNNEAISGWYWISSYSGACVRYQGKAHEPEDDYAITPPLKFEKAGAYKLSITSGGSYGHYERLRILVGKGKTPADLTQEIVNFPNGLQGGSKVSTEYNFVVGEPGTYYVAFHEQQDDPAGASGVDLFDVKVEAIEIVPAAVADAKAIGDLNGENKATITWTNPTKDNVDQDLTALTKVEVYRGETLVYTKENPIVGAAETYVDEVPEPGIYTYYVVAYNENGPQEQRIEAYAGFVGDRTQQLPMRLEPKTLDDFSMFYIVDGNNDGNTWNMYVSTYYQYGQLAHSGEAAGTVSDDWMIAPPVVLTPGSYKVEFRYWRLNGTAARLGYVTDPTNPGETFTVLKDYAAGTAPNTESTSAVSYIINIEQEGKYYLAVQDYTTYNSGTVTSRANLFAISAPKPLAATELTATPGENQALTATFSWKNPTATDIADVTLDKIDSAVVYRNGEKLAIVTEGLTPGEVTTYQDNDIPAAGIYTYAVEIYNNGYKADGDAPSVKCDWVGGGIVVDEENPFGGEQAFLDSRDMWTIVNVANDKTAQGDPATWVTDNYGFYYNSNSVKADDWAITPRLELEEGDYEIALKSYMSRDMSGSTLQYEVAVAPGTDYTLMETLATITIDQEANYRNGAQADTILLTVTDGSQAMPKRAPIEGAVEAQAGINTIGLHAITAGMLYVTDFKVTKLPNALTGVTDINAEGAISIVGGVISGAQDIVVYDITGKVVARGEESVDLSGNNAGIYIVTGRMAGRHVAFKIVK